MGNSVQNQERTTALNRTLSLPLLTFYGLGTILGAGIYVLIGEVAAAAGTAAPTAFLVAAIVAGFTAFSYAELTSRIPESAGEAAFANAAFHKRPLTALAGWGVVFTGIVSAATVTNGFAGYLQEFVAAPRIPVVTLAVLAMGGIAAWGVTQSVTAAAVVTVIELAGLGLVLSVSSHHLGDLSGRWIETLPTSWSATPGLISGAFLAFFAFIGFEDIANMAEETRNPRRNLPLAIVISLIVSTVLYIAVALVAVAAVPLDQLAGNPAPLARILEPDAPWAGRTISLISMVAVINGALIQIVMASRVLYGMAKYRTAPALFHTISPKTQTPLVATAAVTVVILLFATTLHTVALATITSTITLVVFSVVNASLLQIKLSGATTPANATTYPLLVPAAGLVLSVTLLILQFALT
jgi:APA family basic amino acid/polyamine antiporter